MLQRVATSLSCNSLFHTFVLVSNATVREIKGTVGNRQGLFSVSYLFKCHHGYSNYLALLIQLLTKNVPWKT